MADVLPLVDCLAIGADSFWQLLIGGVGTTELVKRPP
jgi:hypothetical protein